VVAFAVTVPSGFTQSQIGGSLDSPTAFAIAPDGRIFVCEQEGRLRVIKDGQLLATPFLSVTVSSVGERGLLGVAFDPAFASNHFVYVYYTAVTPSIHNRLSRFTANGNVAASGSERILLEIDDLTSATNHNGGAIRFGEDSKLYVGVGENATSSNAQTKSNLLGKLLRLNSDGTIPTDNPFSSTASGKNRAIWAIGLRNPFTFAVQPGTGRIFINDVGQDTFEEVDEGREGANYGWPATEGPTSNSAYDSPIYSYAHAGSSDCAITGAAFYNPATPQFPSSYTGDFFFADYCGGWIKRLDAAGSYATASGFATGSRAPWISRFPTTARCTTSRAAPARTPEESTGSSTRSTRLRRSPCSRPTSPSRSAPRRPSRSAPRAPRHSRTSGSATARTFRARRRRSYTIASAQLADNAAAFRCRVTNAYGNVTSSSATLSVTANLVPVAAITSPGNGATYAGGQTIYYSGTGTDPEDGTLPASAFEWEVVFHHDTHTHPFIAPTAGAKSGTFVGSDDGRDLGQRLVPHPPDGEGLGRPDPQRLPGRGPAKDEPDLLDPAVRPSDPPRRAASFDAGHGRRCRRNRADARGDVAAEQRGRRLHFRLLVGRGRRGALDLDADVGYDVHRLVRVSDTQSDSDAVENTHAADADSDAPTGLTHTHSDPASSGGDADSDADSVDHAAAGRLRAAQRQPRGGRRLSDVLDSRDDGGPGQRRQLGMGHFDRRCGHPQRPSDGPGERRSEKPVSRSAPFELAPDTDYDFSAWTKSAGIDGFYGAFVWVVELDADGNVLKNPLGWSVQHAIKAGEGTTDWVKGTTTFRTDPRCAGGSIYANIYRAHGTFWVDDFRVEKSATLPSASASSR
jgi:glucose/arabinose dehydrogenase